MILERNKVRLTVLILVTAVTLWVAYFFISKLCTSNKNSDALYWRFQYIQEKVDSLTDDVKLEISNKKVTKADVDTLVKVLDNWGWEYYITKDTSLFVRQYGSNVINNKKSLTDELYRRKKDTTAHWIYQ
jgi:hypothetical protein